MARLLTLAALLALSSAAAADIITLKDGRVIEGDVIADDGKTVKVKVRFGALTFDRDQILSIEEKPTPEQEYEERLKQLDEKDVRAQFEIGQWAESVKLEKEAVRHFIAAAKMDPGFQAALEELASRDWHLLDGEWVDADTWYPTRGWVRFEGRWTHPLEYSWRLSQQIRKKMEERLASAKAQVLRSRQARERAEAAGASARRTIETKGEQRSEVEQEIPGAEASVRAAERSKDRAERAVERAQWTWDQERQRLQRGEPNAAGQADIDLREAKRVFAQASFDLLQAERRLTDLEKLSASLAGAIEAARDAESRASEDAAAASEQEKTTAAGLQELEQQVEAAQAGELKARTEWEKAKPGK